MLCRILGFVRRGGTDPLYSNAIQGVRAVEIKSTEESYILSYKTLQNNMTNEKRVTYDLRRGNSVLVVTWNENGL